MRRTVRRLLGYVPVPLALAIERAKRAIYPAAGYKQARRLLAAHAPDGRVLAGPFAGMRYVDEAVGSAYLAKVFGSYEHELHGAFADAIATPYDRLVDIGAAEGYYAVGLAVAMPALKVTTFDIDPRGRHLQARLAELNGVADRLEIRGAGDPAAIERALADARRPLVICDCEGAEDQLLVPDLTPALCRAAVIVELHDWLVAGVSGRIRARFAATHDVRQIDESGAVPESFLAPLPAADRGALREGRVVRQSWFVLTPRAS